MRSGLVLVDKPLGVSSHTVVSWARKALGTKKVGHAGTLDPEASGLLVLGVGVGTRLLTFCVGMGKTYHATMRLGYATTTDDAEGERIEVTGGSREACTPEAIDAVLKSFRGDITQVPSTYSAIKVEGKRAYDLARSGAEVVLKARPVTIHSLERGGVDVGDGFIDVTLRIECSSGTYIRALARDIGQMLGVGGHLVALRRTSVGPFDVTGAMPGDAIEASGIIDLAVAAQEIMPTVRLGAHAANDISHGRKIACPDWPTGQPLAALDDSSGELLAVVECVEGFSRILMGVPHS